MTTDTDFHHSPQAAAEQLRKNVAAILATIPNVANCIDGLDTTLYRLIDRRMVEKRGGVYDCDPSEAPPHSPLCRRERERIVLLIDAAIDASGLSWLEADAAVCAPLFEIEDRERQRRMKARRRKIVGEARQ